MSDKGTKEIVDFSQGAIKKAVARQTVEHPAVVYPVAMAALSTAAILALGLNPWIWLLAGGGATLAAMAWGVNYGYRRDVFASEYVRALHLQMEKQRMSRKQELEASLNEVGTEDGKNQYKRMSEKFNAFQRILKKKLNPSELTYARYLGMAEQVYLGALDNLQNVTNMLSTLAVIDRNFITRRLAELKKGKPSSDNTKEIESLEQRLQLFEEQHQKVSALMAQNEAAMTKIDVTIAAITDMRTQDNHASMDIESAMNELQQLAARAKHYSNK